MIDGLGIHFLHARSARPDALPLVLTHGWPGSVVEFLDASELLVRSGFHCVVPSLPGYGWSDKPAEPGWGVERIARAWAAVMAELGYERYGAQGSDWGTSVSASLAQQDPEHVVGVQLMPPLAPPDPAMMHDLSERERDALNALRRRGESDAGYSTEQRTRPQTIGYALADSPAGLAAWVTEKLEAWTDPRSELSTDAVLDNLMLYRARAPRRRGCTGRASATSPAGSRVPSSRATSSTHRSAAASSAPLATVGVTAVHRHPLLERARPRGHFASWEQPDLFAAEVEACFARIR